VLLKFDVEDFKNDIFYFCHIHQFMAGRIKLLKNGVPVTEEDVPEWPYKYDLPTEFDESVVHTGSTSFNFLTSNVLTALCAMSRLATPQPCALFGVY
jgi:hypothetical protein